MTERRQRVLLAVIATIGLLRGGWWVVTTPLWSPIDEQAHYDFVQAMGRFEGPPVVGETRVHRDVLAVAKESSTSQWQSVPVPPDPRRPEWGAFAHSYDGAQPPLYYAVAAPVWRAASPLPVVGTVYVLRVVTLLLSLLLLPLVWLLGRELFPDRPEIGVGAAAVTAVLSGVNGNFAIVANDGLMTVLCAAATLAAARIVRRGFTARRAALLGALIGAAVLTKLTALAIVGIAGIGLLLARSRHRVAWRSFAGHAAVTGGVAAALVAPWVMFNLVTYGGVTASDQLDAITGPLQSDPPLNLDGMLTRLEQAAHGFWDQQLLGATVSDYGLLWFGVAGLTAVAALVRCRRERPVLAWLFAAWPLAFATMALVILGVSGGRSDIVGRHLYVALPALLVAVVAGAVLVVGRWALPLLALVCATGLTLEARDAPALMRTVYTAGAVGDLTPVVDQPHADRVTDGGRFALEAPCPVAAIRLVFRGGVPVITINGTRTRSLASEPLDGGAVAALYAVDEGPARVVVAVPTNAAVATSRLGPAHRLYCVHKDSFDARFAQTFRRGHPPLTAAQVAFPPRVWAVLAWIGVGAAAGHRIRRHRDRLTRQPL